MGIINVLDKHTANLIAAGEVVERPASAIKELLENSADAGATQITVEIKNGGTTYIRVSDNGCGISAEDVPVCILRHATSKIKSESDLAAISTLGFRGEALAAIAAVTRVRIMTKRKEDAAGTYFASNFGEKVEISETGCPDGTTIIAENLFENVPARRKFLRRDVTEVKAVSAAVEKFALSKPKIALTFISDGGVKLKTPGDGKLQSCIYAAVGKEFFGNMLPVNYRFEDIEVSGYIGKPETARPNRNLQNFFINERYVKSGTMSAGLEEGFKSFCPIGKFPACVLFLKINFDKVDINIHPAKLEVKFSNERAVFEAIVFAVRNALFRKNESNLAARDAISAYTPPKAVRQPSDISNAPSSVAINGKETDSSLFSKTSRYDTDIINDAGTVSVPFPQSIEKFYGKQPSETINEKNFDYSVPSYAEQSKKIAEQMQSNSISATPPSENGVADDSKEPEFVRVDLSVLDKMKPPKSASSARSSKSNDEKTEKVEKAENVLTKKEYTPDDISLFESVPKQIEKLPDAPFAEVADKDVSDELMKRVKQGITVIGEAFNSYIIVERNNTLYLIDKHAAHERIIYESLKKGKKDGGSQLLLVPLTVTLAPEESIALAENGEYLENVGFVFEEFGINSYIIRGVPAEIDLSVAEETFIFLAGQIAKAGGKAIGDIFDRALYTAACKAAVKAGTKTSMLSSTMIADILFSDEAVLYCPHGRPVILEFSKSKLDKMFSRT